MILAAATDLHAAVALVAAAVASAGLWALMSATFSAPVFHRANHRGIMVPVGAGVLIAVAVVAVDAIGAVAGADVVLRVPAVYLVAALGFGLLGFIDDVAGTPDAKGFRGHLGALAHGRMTTGGLKLVGGALVALVAASATDDSFVRLFVDAALIALAANLGNLFDRTPGRTTKVGILALAVLWATNAGEPMAGPAAIIGAAIGLLWFELREELMLGDAGANVIGAALGTGVVLSTSFPVRIVVLVVVAALNLLSERVSFTSVIERVPPLRVLDHWGRRRGA